MVNVLSAWAVLVLLKAVAYFVEMQRHLLPQIAEALNISVPGAILAQSPLLAVVLVGLLFIAVGVFFGSRTMILMPLLLCAAEVSALSPLLGIQQISAFASFGQVGILASALAIVGAFILKDSNSVWRIRQGRIGVIWKLIVALEVINLGFHALYTYNPSIGITIFLAAIAMCGGILLWISSTADAAEELAKADVENAGKVQDLVIQVTNLKKARDEWSEACKKAREERDALKSRVQFLEGKLEGRDEVAERSVPKLAA